MDCYSFTVVLTEPNLTVKLENQIFNLFDSEATLSQINGKVRISFDITATSKEYAVNSVLKKLKSERLIAESIVS